MQQVEIQKHLDSAYLSALVWIIHCDDNKMSFPVAKLSFVVSTSLISRLAASMRPSWLTGIHLFRAGLLCLHSSATLEFVLSEDSLGQCITRSGRVCAQMLSRLSTRFVGLSIHSSVLDMLGETRRSVRRSNAVSHDIYQQELINKLPSYPSRDITVRTISALNAPCTGSSSEDGMVVSRLSRTVLALCENDKEDDVSLYRLIITQNI